MHLYVRAQISGTKSLRKPRVYHETITQRMRADARSGLCGIFFVTPNLCHRRWQDRSRCEPEQTENNQKSRENRGKIYRKSSQHRSWSDLGSFGALGGGPGTPGNAAKSVPDVVRTAEKRSWDALGSPRLPPGAPRERPGSLEEPSGRLRDPSQADSER